MVFAARNVGLATAIAITLLGRLEYAVFAAVYFLTEVPLLFGAIALYRHWIAPCGGAGSGDGPQVAAMKLSTKTSSDADPQVGHRRGAPSVDARKPPI